MSDRPLITPAFPGAALARALHAAPPKRGLLAALGDSKLADWLGDHGGHRFGLDEVVRNLGELAREDGVDVWRVGFSLSDYHPEVIGRSYVWTLARGVEVQDRQYTPRRSDLYMRSPIKVIHEGADGLRRRLDGPNAQFDFPILLELHNEGVTDYAGMALKFSDGTRHYIAWSTARPGGFTDDELRRLDDLTPLICLRLELEHSRRVTEQILVTYLGDDAARKVIAGDVRRAAGEEIQAIVFYCDLRGFTRMTEQLDAGSVIRVLAAYYDAVSGPVRARGGDILKMIGDGMLAIFPVREGLDAGRAAHEALAAAKEAREALSAIPLESLPDGVEALAAGFALHIGQVTFGNVGSRDRLDFTAIGPAVNQATRVEGLTKILGRSILLTEEFARLPHGAEVRSLGFHALRGVRDPREIFTPG
jgi:adenylate cyclase